MTCPTRSPPAIVLSAGEASSGSFDAYTHLLRLFDGVSAVRVTPPGHVAGILLDAIFLDLIDYDALVLERLNRLLEKLPRRGPSG